MTDEYRTDDIKCVDSRVIIGNNSGKIIATVGFIAFAVTALIEGSNGMAMFGKDRGNEVPDMGRRGKAVNEHEGRQVRMRCRRKPTAIVDAEIVCVDKVVYGRA